MSTNTTVANNWTRNLPIFVIILAVGLILSISLVATLPTIQLSAPAASNLSSIQLGLEADAVRYTAMAQHFTLQAEALQSSLSADAARYTGMAEYYTANSIQLGLEADAARYTAMAQHYAAKEAARIQSSLDADATRYTAMAEFYGLWWEGIQRSLDADAARYTAMAKYYMP